MFCSNWDELFHSTVVPRAEEARTHAALGVDNIPFYMNKQLLDDGSFDSGDEK